MEMSSVRGLTIVLFLISADVNSVQGKPCKDNNDCGKKEKCISDGEKSTCRSNRKQYCRIYAKENCKASEKCEMTLIEDMNKYKVQCVSIESLTTQKKFTLLEKQLHEQLGTINALQQKLDTLEGKQQLTETEVASQKEDLAKKQDASNALQQKVGILEGKQRLTETEVASQKEELLKKQTDASNALQQKIDTLEGKQRLTETDMASQKFAINHLDTRAQYLTGKIDSWPPGHYCILANGGCPAGFTRFEGYMKAVSMKQASVAYIKAASIGDSRIKCHGTCGQYGNWIGDLILNGCCK